MAKEILEKMESKHIYLYHSISKEEILSFIDDYLKNKKIENDFDFNYFVNVILKKINGCLDAHTDFRLIKKLKLPFYFRMINNEIYLINTINKYKEVLFRKLTSINGIPIDVILNQIENSTSYQTDNWLKHKIEEKLTDYYELFSLPCIDLNTSGITFEFENGKEISLNLDLINDLKDGLKRENSDSKLVFPLKKNFSYYLKNNNIILIYNKCNDKENLVKTVINKISKTVKNDNIDTFILDLRGNTGGDSSVIKPLIDFLKKSDINLITLTDRSVFSSGIIALSDMKDLGSLVIGEEVGAFINGFGYCLRYEQIMDFEYRICHKYFYQVNGVWNQISDKQDFEHISSDVFNPEIIMPDIIVNLNIDDLIKGKDTILTCATDKELEKKK